MLPLLAREKIAQLVLGSLGVALALAHEGPTTACQRQQDDASEHQEPPTTRTDGRVAIRDVVVAARAVARDLQGSDRPSCRLPDGHVGALLPFGWTLADPSSSIAELD